MRDRHGSSGILAADVCCTYCLWELPAGRAEVPISLERQRRSRRQASHLNRPTYFFAGATSIRTVVCASTRGESSMIREKSHAADTTRLCRDCVLRDLRGNGVHCDRCVC